MLYEPEAIGHRAYAPVGERREKIKTERELAADPSSLSELRPGRLHKDPHRQISSMLKAIRAQSNIS
jgi:hypothetical protein